MNGKNAKTKKAESVKVATPPKPTANATQPGASEPKPADTMRQIAVLAILRQKVCSIMDELEEVVPDGATTHPDVEVRKPWCKPLSELENAKEALFDTENDLAEKLAQLG
jgi:hypothetical protein